MKSLSLLGLLALGLACPALLLSIAPALCADEHPHHAHMVKCARACLDCQLECDTCFLHCKTLVLGGAKDHARTMDTCLGCAEMCSLAAKLAARNSPFAGTVCETCAKICDECGEACSKFKEDQHMSRCAKACSACAAECREMLKHLNQ
jgi:Domain of Unknown Function (DUF326)